MTKTASNVVKLPAAKPAKRNTVAKTQKRPAKARRPRGQSQAFKVRVGRQGLVFKAASVVLGVMLSVSLPHIAGGYAEFTGSTSREAYSMAVSIEAAYIVAEMAKLFASTPAVRKAVARFADPFMFVSMAMSAAFNANASSLHEVGYGKIVPAIIGAMIPFGIYAFARIWAALYPKAK